MTRPARQTPAPEADPLAAASISVTSCGCGAIYVRFHGPTGNIIAFAGMSTKTARSFSENIGVEIEKTIKGQACGCASEAVH